MFLRISFLLSILSFVLAACSGNGYNIPPGQQCGAGFAAAAATWMNPQLPPAAHKVTIAQKGTAPDPKTQLPPGQYIFTSVDIAYVEAPTEPSVIPMKFAMHDDVPSEAQAKPLLVSCVRDAHFVLAPQSFVVQAPSAMNVAADGTLTYTQRTFTLNITPVHFEPKLTVISDPQIATDNDISQIFKNSKDKLIGWFITANPTGQIPNDYLLTASYSCSADEPPCTYSMNLHMTYFNPGVDIPPEMKIPDSVVQASQKPQPAAPAPTTEK